MENKYNFDKVFSVFKKNYILVPLEIFTDPYKALISTVLSARTRDEVTLEVCQRLFKIAPTLEKLNKLEETEIRNLIRRVGFYRTKARHLKQIAHSLLEKYDGKIPQTRNGLIKLPGVGRKTANLVLNRAFHKHAISVDTHVHRISNLLGWVNTKTPEKTEFELSRILPKKYWSNVNRFFVSIGRQHGTGRKLISFLKSESLI